MKKIFSIICILVLFYQCSSKNNEIIFEGTSQQIPDSSIIPNIPIWTDYAKIFIYAPAFNFPTIDGAVEYKYTITCKETQQSFSFIEKTPNHSMSKIWEYIPEGIVNIVVEGIDKNHKTLGTSGTKKIYRAAAFNGIKNTAKNSYKESATHALQYIFNLPHIQQWISDDRPNLYYSLYGYPSKIISSLMEGMLLYSSLETTSKDDSVKAMKIVLNMASHLERISSSKSKVLKSFVPTYDLEFVNERIQIKDIPNQNGVNNIVKINSNKLMMLYGYEYANVLLELYQRTKDKKWYNKVISITDAYKQLQLPEGNWHLNIDYHTTTPIDSSMMMPTRLIEFLRKLEIEYGITDYRETIKKAEAWMENQPMKTFFWEAQFEDVPTYKEKYRSLSKYPPSDYAIYLLENYPDKKNIERAKELIRFAEDQFVIWNNPPDDSILYNPWASKDTVQWLTPCVLEQYHFYVPVDASACQMIKAFMSVYKITKEQEYYDKAVALANSITRAQQENGEITTVWTKSGFETENWLNCMVLSSKTLLWVDENY